eukprot:TRINITY_DN47259_c0_g1_i1.p1 TRINITY_DN47259_c0_g1~~TRINITY_DN47259_c0_g1_i1.p1  ORF type:complete len:490 (+),score=72.87 TRINITY_DN47259_c0_g1_i1:76-1470(+)
MLTAAAAAVFASQGGGSFSSSYKCNLTTGTCYAVSADAGAYDYGLCSQPCRIGYSCLRRNTNISSCLADTNCLWSGGGCSQDAGAADARLPPGKGSFQCASSAMVANGQVTCYSNGDPDPRQQFRERVLSASFTYPPAGFDLLVQNVPSPNVGIGLGNVSDLDFIGTFLASADPPLTAAVHQELSLGIHALLFSGSGRQSTAVHDRFTLVGSQVEYRSIFAGVLARYGRTFLVGYAHGQGTAILRGPGHPHKDGLRQAAWAASTQASVIKQGLRALVHNALTARFNTGRVGATHRTKVGSGSRSSAGNLTGAPHGFKLLVEMTGGYLLTNVEGFEPVGLVGDVTSEFTAECRKLLGDQVATFGFSHDRDPSTVLTHSVPYAVYNRSQAEGGCGISKGCAGISTLQYRPFAKTWRICTYKGAYQPLSAQLTVNETRVRGFLGAQCDHMLGRAAGGLSASPVLLVA